MLSRRSAAKDLAHAMGFSVKRNAWTLLVRSLAVFAAQDDKKTLTNPEHLKAGGRDLGNRARDLEGTVLLRSEVAPRKALAMKLTSPRGKNRQQKAATL